jgi:hypothetical protein
MCKNNPNHWATFFHSKNCAKRLTKNVLGYFWGDFFTNSSGHPGRGPMLCSLFLRFLPIFGQKIGVFLETQCYVDICLPK